VGIGEESPQHCQPEGPWQPGEGGGWHVERFALPEVAGAVGLGSGGGVLVAHKVCKCNLQSVP
jgi:hypothetical protein